MSQTLGRLLTHNTDLLEEIHYPLINEEFIILKNKGFIGVVTEILDGEHVKVIDEDGQEWKVSIFEMRSLDYNLGCKHQQP